MKLYRFMSEFGMMALTIDKDGANLPSGKGRWGMLGSIDFDPDGPPRDGMRNREIAVGIAARGYVTIP